MSHELEFDVLDDPQVHDALKQLPGWTREGVKIRKQYAFNSFREAIAFVNRVAEVAEQSNHHPDIEVHYKNVDILLWTHKKSAVTRADITVATEVEQVAGFKS